MSDYVERVEAFLDAREASGEARRGTISATASESRGDEKPGMYRRPLTDADLRALVADAKQLRAQATEYGIDATFASTRSATFTVADSLGDALKALEEFDAERGDVACRQLVERPVGEWRKVGGERG